MAAHAIPITQVSLLGDAQVEALAQLLAGCVDAGAVLGFMAPLALDKAQAYWREVAAGLAQGDRALLVAVDARGIAGTVQLLLAQPDNQAHCAEVAALMVRPDARGQGLGQALMLSVEGIARGCEKSLLLLDTAAAGAARLYTRIGWRPCGVIPGHVLLPQGGRGDTACFYRELSGG